MPKKLEDHKLVEILLPRTDLETLRRFYPMYGSLPSIVRALLRRHIRRLETNLATKLSQSSTQPRISLSQADEILSAEELKGD